MHIGFLCDQYPPWFGGVGTFTQTLARALVSRGHDVTVVGVRAEGHQQIDQGVRVIRLPFRGFRGIAWLISAKRRVALLRRLHAEKPFDALEGSELMFAFVPKDFPCAKIIRMHGGHRFFASTLGVPPRPWSSFQERRSFRHANFYAAVSNYVGETTRSLLGLDREITVIPNPVNTTRFSPVGHSAEPGRIVFVGTLCEKKGVRQLVQAMAIVHAKVPDARLWLVGPDSKDRTGGSYADGLRKLITPELAPCIEFRGKIDNAELPGVLGSAEICVYPSHMEALPVAWLEGLAMGKAVLASKTGPGPEVIDDGVTGLLCDPHDPNDIAEKLIRLLTDPDLRARLGRAARERILAQSSAEALIDRNIEFYQRCIEAYRRDQT